MKNLHGSSTGFLHLQLILTFSSFHRDNWHFVLLLYQFVWICKSCGTQAV